jgi:hypothetical protein
MKSSYLVCILLVTSLLALGVQLFGQSSREIKNPTNPPAFQKYAAPVSGRIAFFASENGKQFLLHSPNPMAKTFLTRFWGSAVASQWDTTPHAPYRTPGPPSPASSKPQAPLASILATTSRCAQTRFNLEPATNALPQNEPAIDFKIGAGPGGTDQVGEGAQDLRGFFLSPASWSPSASGYYFGTTGVCTPQFEGGTPPIRDPLSTQPNNFLIGFADPNLIYDSNHDTWTYASIYLSSSSEGVGLLRNTNSRLTNTSFCPNGTHNLAATQNCWLASLGTNVADEQTDVSISFADKPNMAIDTRASGTGAGDVYVTDTLFLPGPSVINLTACTNTLSACSTAETISGSDSSTQFSDVKTYPNTSASAGTISVTYAQFNLIATFTTIIPEVDIKYVECTPMGAPIAPTCGPPTLVASEFQPQSGLLAGMTDVRNSTYPVHVVRNDGTIFVFWERCAVFPSLPFGVGPLASGVSSCPDTDILYAFSTNKGATWTGPLPVDIGYGHQIQPWVDYDPTQDIVSLVYNNCNNTARNFCSFKIQQIASGSTAIAPLPPPVAPLTTVPESDANRPFFQPLYGDYIGIQAHSCPTCLSGGPRRTLWIAGTDTLRQGSYNGALVNESNNNVFSFDY